MITKILAIFILVLSPIAIKSEEFIFPHGVDSTQDSKNLEWNRYTVDNIVILSINKAQGYYLMENTSSIKSWCLTRWGFPDVKSTKECRIFCVPNKVLLKKMFGLDKSKIEIRKDITVIWMSSDDNNLIIPFLSQVVLLDFEEKHGVSIGWWFKRGFSQLNCSLPEIRQNIINSDVLKNPFTSEKIFTMTEETYNKESLENKNLFDQQVILLCVMLRKEFGEAKLQGFLRMGSKNDVQDVLKIVYGFSGYKHFDKQYMRFMRDLTSDILNNKTPDSYLEIKPVR